MNVLYLFDVIIISFLYKVYLWLCIYFSCT